MAAAHATQIRTGYSVAMDDDDDDDAGPPLPPGTRNHITPAGHARLVAELHQLMKIERPKVVEIVSWAAGNGDRSENGDYLYGKKRLREIDRRARFLMKRLNIAEIVDPSATPDRGQVRFGATVTFVNEADVERRVTILGVDEADLSRGEVSLHAPIARALMQARVGDTVRMVTPRGPELVEILAIDYPTSSPSPEPA
jgi:transcription elongation factor GreB